MGENTKSRSTGCGSSIGGLVWLESATFKSDRHGDDAEVVVFTVRDQIGGRIISRGIATPKLAADLESFTRSLRNVLADSTRAATKE